MKRYGFTLLELMVVIFIFSIIMAATFGVLSMGTQSWHTGSTQVELQQETRRAMDWMVKEIRQSAEDAIPSMPNPSLSYNSNSITFRVPDDIDGDGDVIDVGGDIEWGNTITYSLLGNQVQRTSVGVTTVLANRVVNLQFTKAANIPIIEISLQAQKDAVPGRAMQSTLNSQVTLRN